MSRRIRGKALKINIDQFVKAYNASMEKRLNTVAQEIQKFIEDLLSDFVSDWETGFESPDPRYRGHYANLQFTVEAEVKTFSDGSHYLDVTLSTKNKLFHWLDKGTAGYVARQNILYYPMESHRTVRNQLMLHTDSYGTYSETPAMFKKGETVPGIDPRHWTEAIEKLVLYELNTRYPELKFRTVSVDSDGLYNG